MRCRDGRTRTRVDAACLADDHSLDDIITDHAFRTRTRRVHQTVETLHREPATPLRHRCRVAAELLGDLTVRAVLVRAGNTIRQRNANACDDECRRAQRCKVRRSSPVNSISTVDRPRRAITRLRCWLTTPDNATDHRKFPFHQIS